MLCTRLLPLFYSTAHPIVGVGTTPDAYRRPSPLYAAACPAVAISQPARPARCPLPSGVAHLGVVHVQLAAQVPVGEPCMYAACAVATRALPRILPSALASWSVRTGLARQPESFEHSAPFDSLLNCRSSPAAARCPNTAVISPPCVHAPHRHGPHPQRAYPATYPTVKLGRPPGMRAALRARSGRLR